MGKKTKGIVCAGHEKTADVAVEIFREGGNAFDASLAAFMASFVTEPCMSSLGGGGFLIASAKGGQRKLIDFFCQTPKIKKPANDVEFFPVQVNFGTITEDFHVGMGSVGVPGTPAGIFSFHEDYCTLPLEVLAQPAIDLARKGVMIDPFQHYDFTLLHPILKMDLGMKPVFFSKGSLVDQGELMYMPQLADILEVMVKEGRDLFYKGDIARDIVYLSDQHGGYLTREDLENYQVLFRQPLEFQYRDHKIITNPPPSAGGVLIALMMHFLSEEKSLPEPLSKDHVLLLQKVLQQTERMRENELEFDRFCTSIWNLDLNLPGGSGPFITSKRGNTTHISVLDEDGNAVSLSTTNGEGSGYSIPDTQIMLNNMLGEAALFPGGFHSWGENQRVSSMMAPTLVSDQKGRVVAVLGTGGAGRIPSSIMQTLHFLLDYDFSVQDAVNGPRLYWHEGLLNMEPGYPREVEFPDDVNQVIYWQHIDMFFGGVHTIAAKKDQVDAMGDPRRMGIVRKSD